MRVAGSADVDLATGGVSATVCRDVDVVVVAVPAGLGTAGRVIHAAPDAVLQVESVGVLQCELDDPVSERDAFGRGRVRNHHVQGEAIGMPPQRVGPNTADVLNLR